MERVRIGDVEAQNKHIGVRIGEGSNGVVITAARCVPNRVFNRRVVDKVPRGILLKVRWNICLENIIK